MTRPRMAMPQSIGAIIGGWLDPMPMSYGGVPMRSHLEADFARYLDRRAIPWVYEPETFGPHGQGYLPDFRLIRPDGRHYVEVKPTVRQAVAAQSRMAVIWETLPDAVLVAVSAEESRFWGAIGRGSPWETWVERWAHT